MQKSHIIIGAVLMALGVILDAYASHGLSAVAGYSIVNAFRSGVDYQYYHAIAFIVLGLTENNLLNKKMVPVISSAFWIGLFLFSINMYLVCFCKVHEWDMVLHSVQFLLPIGAGAFMVAWILYVIAILLNKSNLKNIN